MKRKRELETKTEVKSIIEELSLLIKLIRRTRRNNDDNNHDNNKKAQPPAAATVAAAAATTAAAAAAAAAVGAEISDDQQKLVVSNIPTRPFLSICSFLIQVLGNYFLSTIKMNFTIEFAFVCSCFQLLASYLLVNIRLVDTSYKIGPTMAVLRQDIYKNIQRLEMLCDSDPTKYSNLVEILKKEAVERNAKKGESCSKALVWLTRSLDFTAALLQKLADEPKESMELIVGNSYETTLKPWHGWISATAYKVALKLVPETGTFISLLMDKGENIDTFKEEIQTLNSLLEPLLEDLHSILSSYGLEKLKST